MTISIIENTSFAVRASWLRCFALSVIIVVISACTGDATPFEEAIETERLQLVSIAISPPIGSLQPLFISPGEQIPFGITGITATGANIQLSAADRRWAVDNPELAAVDEDGNLVGLASGVVRVGVQIDTLVSNFELTVSNEPLTGISRIVGDTNVSRCLPEVYSAIALHGAEERSLRDASWSVNFSGLGEITSMDDGSALLNAVNTGTIDVTVTSETFSNTTSVVINDNLRQVAVEPDSLSVTEGSTTQLAAIGTYLEDGDSIVRNITSAVSWQVSDENAFATVSDEAATRGLLTGVSDGTTTVTAACGSFSDTASVTVTDADSDVLSFVGSNPLTVFLVNESTRLSVTDADGVDVSADDATFWSVSDSEIATINDEGLITFLATGNVTVTVSRNNETIMLDVTIQ